MTTPQSALNPSGTSPAPEAAPAASAEPAVEQAAPLPFQGGGAAVGVSR